MKTIIDFEFTDDNGVTIEDCIFQTVQGDTYNISIDIEDLTVKKTCVENSSAVRDHIFYLLGVAHSKPNIKARKGTITITKL